MAGLVYLKAPVLGWGQPVSVPIAIASAILPAFEGRLRRQEGVSDVTHPTKAATSRIVPIVRDNSKCGVRPPTSRRCVNAVLPPICAVSQALV